jgi:hypothetical protein
MPRSFCAGAASSPSLGGSSCCQGDPASSGLLRAKDRGCLELVRGELPRDSPSGRDDGWMDFLSVGGSRHARKCPADQKIPLVMAAVAAVAMACFAEVVSVMRHLVPMLESVFFKGRTR